MIYDGEQRGGVGKLRVRQRWFQGEQEWLQGEEGWQINDQWWRNDPNHSSVVGNHGRRRRRGVR